MIEITVVLVVIVVMASLITPRVITMRSQQEQRAAFGQLLDFTRSARGKAIEDGVTYALAYDGSKSQFVMKKEPPPDQAAAVSGTIPAPVQRPLANVQSASDMQDVTTLQMPDGISPTKFVVQQNSVDPSSFLLHFYPDGTSDGGGVEITRGTDTNSLQVTQEGYPTMMTGPLPDTTEQEWPAGTYVQKI